MVIRVVDARAQHYNTIVAALLMCYYKRGSHEPEMARKGNGGNTICLMITNT